MEQELRGLIDAANRTLVSLGVRMKVVEQNGQAVAYIRLPTQPRPLILSARVALPQDIVGGKLGKKIKAKAKTVAKKIAKSKVLGKVVKIASALASTALPGGQAIAAAAGAVKLAKKLKAAAKHGTPKQKAQAKVTAKVATALIQRQRANAPPVAQGYPRQTAAALPDNRTPPQLPGGNGYGDTDPEEFEEAMDPDQGAPDGSVDVDADEEIAPDDDTSEDDGPSDDESE